VRLFNRHSIFIGPIGSAFHSLLYALPGKTLRTVVFGDTVSYYDPGYYPDYFMVDSLKGIRSTYIFDPAEANKPAEKATLDANATVAALERLSII
jgi:capsular polysaccharide biosynthesis protein